jgi:hypothetical protein
LKRREAKGGAVPKPLAAAKSTPPSLGVADTPDRRATPPPTREALLVDIPRAVVEKHPPPFVDAAHDALREEAAVEGRAALMAALMGDEALLPGTPNSDGGGGSLRGGGSFDLNALEDEGGGEEVELVRSMDGDEGLN